MKRLLLLFICLLCNLSAQPKQIEFIANYAVDVNRLTKILKERNFDAEVVSSDLSQYEPSIRRKKGKLNSWLERNGLDFSPQVSLSNSTAKIVFWNIKNRYIRKLNLAKLPKEKLVLFMWEPPTVLPNLYRKEVQNYFSKIYTWDDDLVDNKVFFKYYYPVLEPMIPNLPTFAEKKLCTLVASNLASPHNKELYSERKKAIDFFEQMNNGDFEFYGRGWDASQYKTYKGTTGDKINTIKNYRFSICYENTCDVRGYITEKIFDCFWAGNVPVYWGASNVTDYIPKNCFVDRRDFKNLDELYLFLKNMSQEEYEGYLERIRAYLSSEKAKVFSWTHFENIFYSAVVDN